MDLNDKIRGSLVAGAIGDALGYPVEFLTHSFILQRYGTRGITDYDLEDGIAPFSDDTQMTLYTAEGILQATKDGSPILPAVTDAYLYWYAGQRGSTAKTTYSSELYALDEVNQNRAPGNTCLSALGSIERGYAPSNTSKGCGGVMRIAPVALYGASHGWTLEQTARLAGDIAEITHLHQMSTLASACCAAVIQLCATSDDGRTLDGFKAILEQSLQCISQVYPSSPYLDDFKTYIRKAISLVDSELPDWQVIEDKLGGGWVAEEALAIALYSVARHIDNFDDCLVCAVNHGGDSDSTGAVAGNIIGAILGYSAIPSKYLTPLQLHPLILAFADRLDNNQHLNH